VEICNLSIVGIELLLPVAFKVDGVDEDESSQGIDCACWNNLRNFVVCLRSHPVVDSRSSRTAVTPVTKDNQSKSELEGGSCRPRELR